MFYASREYKRCSVDSGRNWILQAQASEVAGAHWVCLSVKMVIVIVVCYSRTVNNTLFFLSLSLSLPFLTFPFFLCWLPYFSVLHLCLHFLTLLNALPLSVFHPNFSLHRMQYAPTCPSISVLWDMRMTLARSGWSMIVNSSTDVIWVVDDPESFRKRTSTFLCHSKLCFQPLLLCASLCLHTFMYFY